MGWGLKLSSSAVAWELVELPFIWGGGKERRKTCFWDNRTLKGLLFEVAGEVEALEKVLEEMNWLSKLHGNIYSVAS